jgi:hypothetical protein
MENPLELARVFLNNLKGFSFTHWTQEERQWFREVHPLFYRWHDGGVLHLCADLPLFQGTKFSVSPTRETEFEDMQYNLQDARTVQVKRVLEGFTSLISLQLTLDFTWFRYPQDAFLGELRMTFQALRLTRFRGSYEYPYSQKMPYFLAIWLPASIRDTLQHLDIRMERTDADQDADESEGFNLAAAFTEYYAQPNVAPSYLLAGTHRGDAWHARASKGVTMNPWHCVFDDNRGDPDLGLFARFLNEHLPLQLRALQSLTLPPVLLGTCIDQDERFGRAHSCVSELLRVCDRSNYLLTVTVVMDRDSFDFLTEPLNLGPEPQQHHMTVEHEEDDDVFGNESPYYPFVFTFYDPSLLERREAPGLEWVGEMPDYIELAFADEESATSSDTDLED